MTPTFPLPPRTLPPPNIKAVGAGTVLHRTHTGTFRAAQFNPGIGQPTRFATIEDVHGNLVPSLYAATSREAAAFESIFHDIEPTARFKTVTLNAVESRSVSTIMPKRELRLASLFAPDLKAWGIARVDLIETPKSTYAQTALWAKAIHATFANVDGLVWTSRQCDPDQCVILFGDRVGEQDFDVVEFLHVKGDAALLLQLRAFGARAGITITA